MRYHLTTARIATIKKSTNSKCWRWCEQKGTLLYCWWECNWVQPLWKTVWRFLRKLKIELPFDPAIPLLGNYPEKTMTQKDTCTTMIITTQFYSISIPNPQCILLPLNLSHLETISFSKYVSQYLFCREVHCVLFSDSTCQ